MEKKIWYLDSVDLYEILCPNKFSRHVSQHPLTKYHKNDFLFLPDEIAKEIYLIVEGKIKVGYYDEDGNELVLAYLNKGEILGETAYLGHKKHREFAQVMQESTQACKMTAEKARELSREYVPFALEINKKIADRILRLERRLEILFYKDVRRRLKELLKDLKQMYPCTQTPGWVDHGLTQQELASLIGTSRKTVSLLLNELEKEGKIELTSGKFRPLEPSLTEVE